LIRVGAIKHDANATVSRNPAGGHTSFIQRTGDAVNNNGEQVTSQMPAAAASTPAAQPHVNIRVANLKSTYCNMCNANSTREEVVLNFGVNQNWDRERSDPDVSLEHRIILSPFAAKRLSQMLVRLVEEYEARHGVLG
jgi:hypothetical protein